MKPVLFSAVGDALIQRRIFENYEGAEKLKTLIDSTHVRFVNLETIIDDGKGFANETSGGSWLRITPHQFEDLMSFGFNLFSFANNHSMDFSHKGLMETITLLDQKGLTHAGCGENLDKAALPSFLELGNSTIALIAGSSTFEAGDRAGRQSRFFKGRPGINALDHNVEYCVTHREFEVLENIVKKTKINGYKDILRKEGYLPSLSSDTLMFGDYTFRVAEESSRRSYVNEKDMQRFEESIKDAKRIADYVIVAMHSHETKGDDKEEPDDFFVDFCHKAIDAGADVIFGSGPHLLRPLEIYKGCPIFYSLGDFILQNESIPYAPEEHYEMYDMSSDEGIGNLFKKRSNNFTRGLQRDRLMFESVLPIGTWEDGKLKKLILYPLSLGFGRSHSRAGLPFLDSSNAILERFQQMSKHFGTSMILRNGYAEVVIGE